MGIYDEPRAGVTNSLMRQQQQARPFDAGFNNGNSLYAGGAPQQGLFGSMSTANSLQSGGAPAAPVAPSGAMGFGGGTVTPQQPQMDMGGGAMGQLTTPPPPPQGNPMSGIFGQGSPYSGIFGNTPGVQRGVSLGGGDWGGSSGGIGRLAGGAPVVPPPGGYPPFTGSFGPGPMN